MRNFATIVGFSFLLALLTWLLLRGADSDAPAYATTLRAFDDYALAEASLHRDVLQSRAGLLRDYDSFVSAVRAMQNAVVVLRSHARMAGLDAGPVDRLASAVARQEELVEQFKTSNALLQNSLSYVGPMSTNPAFHAQDPRLASAINALAAAVLYLSRDTSSDALKALQERIDRFGERVPTGSPDDEVARAMLAHARLLYQELPAVDVTLKAFIAVPSRQAMEEARAMFVLHRSTVAAVEQRFRLLLYLVSLVMLVFLLLLGLRLRARAIALRRRAALEHVIAENSTRLINCSPAEMEARLKQVLGEFGRAIGADRAYVVLDEKPVRSHLWSADEKPFPPGWPDRALTLPGPLTGGETDNIAIPDVTALPSGPLKDSLAAVGVCAWICLPLSRPGGVRTVMGFDVFQPCNGIFPLSIVRLAGDAVANALERDFLERERAKLTVRLERGRRMQMVGMLASGIAHNFNNIIAAILGYSEMVEPQLARGTKPARHVEEIRRAATRGRDLVDNILTFGRRADSRLCPVQVRSLLEETTALLRVSLPSEVSLVLEEVSSHIAVAGEPAQLQQIILNLCSNAAQSMDGRGSIRVAARQEDLIVQRRMSDGQLPPGRYACISVSDNGRGFDEHVARRLFEPFFTTRLAGTGLGLATVREIVSDHEGAVHVWSKPGRGSRFDVWLPAMRGEGCAALARPSPLPLGSGETVLIVENERERLTRDEEELAALGYEPIGFDRPVEALAACRSQPGRFDAVLVSLGSQAQGGLDLARALHEIVPSKPVLLAAASSSDVNVNELAEAGISELLHWPLVSSELAAALARGLRPPAALRS